VEPVCTALVRALEVTSVYVLLGQSHFSLAIVIIIIIIIVVVVVVTRCVGEKDPV
jgi:hypothetical protein